MPSLNQSHKLMSTVDFPMMPLVVGVSGHRDILDSDIPEIRTRVISELKLIEDTAKDLRLILISGLAKGCDQIVAEEALNRKWEVVAVLPMPFADYLGDFPSDQEREKLVALKGRCSSVIEIPWAASRDLDINDPNDQQYRNQGVFIARHSQVVIALWDGLPASEREACGTAYVAKLCREGSLPPIDGEVLAAPETTPLIHIPVRRESAPKQTAEFPRTPQCDLSVRKIIKEFSAYATATAGLRKKNPQIIQKSRELLISQKAWEQLDDGTKALVEHYCSADALAVDRQNTRNWVIRWASIATVAGAFAQATNGIHAHSSWMIAYGVAVAIAYGLYLLFIHLPFFRIEDRYLEYRALAEALRVQIFWRIAGIPAVAAEHYLQLAKTEVGWVREALRSIWLSESNSSSRREPDYGLVKRWWIDYQANFFVGENPRLIEGKALKCKRWQKRFDMAANVALGVGVVLVAMAGAAVIFPLLQCIKETASAYSASFFLLAAVIKGYVSSMGYAEQAISYEKMGAIFRGIQQIFEHNQASVREERLRALVLALGKQALAENADWLIQHRKNAFEVQS